MDILISSHGEEALLILEKVKAYFAKKFPEEELNWKCSGTVLTTSLQTDEEEITRIFEELVKIYPELSVKASYSYDVREDDTSAQWWGVTSIYSEEENGETKIFRDSSTYWN